MAITSRQGLIEYCLRKLGAPVLEINVDDDQIEDRIDDALQMYQEYHFDAIIRAYHKYQILQADVDNRYITTPDYITFIQRILPIGSGGAYSSKNMFSLTYQFAMNDLYPLAFNGQVAEYTMTMSKLELMDMTFSGAEGIRYNRNMGRLYIDVDWGTEIKAGDWLILEAYRIVSPDEYNKIYNDIFLKQYATALIKRQWGQNLIKFEGMQLPGGVTMNGRQLFDDATQELQQLEEQMQTRYEEPVDFFVG